MKAAMSMPAGDVPPELRLGTMGGEVDSKRICINRQCQNLNLWVLFLSYSSEVVVGRLVGFWIYGFPSFIPPSPLLPSFLPFFLTIF